MTTIRTRENIKEKWIKLSEHELPKMNLFKRHFLQWKRPNEMKKKKKKKGSEKDYSIFVSSFFVR